MAKSLKVAIIGAGVSGLCLAQGLKRAGVEVRVFERDREPASRLKGYRLSISPMGSRALLSCLGPEAFERLSFDTARPTRSVTFLDHRMRRLLAFNLPVTDRASLEAERPIGRLALRQALLEGLEAQVEFGRTFVKFDDSGDTPVARFSDGGEQRADVIVGADGASSPLRRQLLPGPARIDTGILAVGGKRALDAQSRAETPEPVLDGPTLVIGPKGRFLFASAVVYDDLGAEAGDREAYVTWGLSAPRGQWELPDLLEAVAPERMKARALELTEGWETRLRRIVEATDVRTLTVFNVKSAAPVTPWRTRRVTLMGDALHNMPPYQGVGANAALWDAEVLRAALVAAQRGETPLIEALHRYERQAIEHGFALVQRSMEATRRFHETNPARRLATRAFFRALDRWPALRERMFARR